MLLLLLRPTSAAVPKPSSSRLLIHCVCAAWFTFYTHVFVIFITIIHFDLALRFAFAVFALFCCCWLLQLHYSLVVFFCIRALCSPTPLDSVFMLCALETSVSLYVFLLRVCFLVFFSSPLSGFFGMMISLFTKQFMCMFYGSCDARAISNNFSKDSDNAIYIILEIRFGPSFLNGTRLRKETKPRDGSRSNAAEWR